MTILSEILREEYGRSLRLSRHMEAELEALPKGSVRVRLIRGHEYYYLTYRDGAKVKSDYVPATKLADVRAAIARRKELEAALKDQGRSRAQIERALGKELDIE